MGREDRYSNTEADAGRYDRAVFGDSWSRPQTAAKTKVVCNCCLREVTSDDDPKNGLCGPCNCLETPESGAEPDA